MVTPHSLPILAAPTPPVSPLPFVKYVQTVRRNFIAGFHEAVFTEPIVETKNIALHSFIINDAAGVKHVLVDNASNYVKSKIEHRILGPALGNGLVTSEGETWRVHRRMMAPFFDSRSIPAYAVCMTDAANKLLAQWDTLPAGSSVEVSQAMMHLTLEIISRTMFSSQSDGIVDLVRESSEKYQNAMMYGLLDFVPLLGTVWGNYKIWHGNHILKECNTEILRLIAERERPEAAAIHDDLLQRLVCAKDAETGGRMTASEVRDQVFTIFVAGHETTALNLMWTLYLLSQHPDADTVLHNELATVLAGRLPTYDDIPNLPFTKMVIQESMRLYPPIHSLAWREPLKDDVVCGRNIPKGSVVSIAPWVLHRHHSLWEQPERFLPERFSTAAEAKRGRFSYLPFGFGPRICIGAAFAMTEAILVLATLAQRYRLLLAPGHVVEPQALITLRAKYGMKMVLERR